MKFKYISQEKLEVIRKFLETKDLSNIPGEIQWVMWRAKKLYATVDSPQKYVTDSEYAMEDIAVDFDKNGNVSCVIIFNEFSGKSWTLK